MTGQQIGLLITQFGLSLITIVYLGVLHLRSREARHKYRLYACRDRLVYLVASGELSETSMVFKVFYRAMNSYITALDSLTLVSFIQASMAVKKELEKEHQERLAEAIQRATPEVQQAIQDFFRAVMDALRYNSPMLNLILVVAHHCTRAFSYIRKMRKFKVPVYDAYRFYENFNGKLGLGSLSAHSMAL